MKVVRQGIEDGATIYKVLGRDGRFPLVTVEAISNKTSISITSTKDGMTAREAIEYAQALLIGVEIMNALNDGNQVKPGDILMLEE
jgi:hypothetical protein